MHPDPGLRSSVVLLPRALAFAPLTLALVGSACTSGEPAPATTTGKSGKSAAEPAQTTAVAPSTGDEPTTAVPEPPAAEPPPAAAANPPIVYFVDEMLWRVEADGTGKRALGLELAPAGPGLGGTVGHGDSTPTVSRDGRWVAWANATDLFIGDLAGVSAVTTQVTKMPAAKDEWILAAEIAFSTWSPDSQTLVVMLREPSYMEDDPLPLPAGVAYGFHVLHGTDAKLTPAPQIEGVYGWTGDSTRVLDSKYLAKNDYELRAYPIAGGSAEVLRKTTDGYGFTQLQADGDWYAWTSSVDGSQILVAAVAGGEPKPMSPAGAFAELSWPAVAPDGAHALFQWKGEPHLGSGPDASSAKPLPAGTWQWYASDRLIGVGPDGLAFVGLDGEQTVLDPAATALPRR